MFCASCGDTVSINAGAISVKSRAARPPLAAHAGACDVKTVPRLPTLRLSNCDAFQAGLAHVDARGQSAYIAVTSACDFSAHVPLPAAISLTISRARVVVLYLMGGLSHATI